MRSSRTSGLLLAAALVAFAPTAAADEAAACLDSIARNGIDQATALDPDLDAASRHAALKRIIAHAANDEDHGRAAYLLGALFRLGEAHPAALVERDAESARSWFGRCVAIEDCPMEVFAALAELELAEGRTHEALVYTHIYLNLNRLGGTGNPGYYDVMLLERVLAAHGRVDEVRLQAGIDAYVDAHGADLQRILGAMAKPPGTACDGALTFAYDYDGGRPPTQRQARGRNQAGVYAWYLAPVNQEPTYPDKALLFDALPDAAQARGLERNVRTLRVKANRAPPVGARWWTIIPVKVEADGVKPVLIQKKPVAGRDNAESDATEGGTDD